MELPEPDNTGDDRTLLNQFLDFQRAVMVRKAEGLTQEQLAVRLGPSEMTIGGMLKHLALVEDAWFRVRLLGHQPSEPWASVDWDADPDWEFHTAADDTPQQLLAWYREACEQSRAAVAQVDDLDTLCRKPNRQGIHYSLRWVLIHMIEETARHLGHADLLRETIDGAKGD